MIKPLRIVSWNIRAGGGRRIDLIAEQVGRWNADVVALSEFRGTPPSFLLKQRLQDQGLTHQLSTVEGCVPISNRVLLVSRWPLFGIRFRGAPTAPGRWCAAQVGAPRPFVLAAMHVPNRVSGHKYPFHTAVLNLARSWRRGPGLLVGDTNSGRIGIDEEVPAFNKLEDGWIAALERYAWHDGFRRLYGDERVYTWYSPNGRNGFRIDQAFINRHLLPRLIDTHYEWAYRDADDRRDAVSDHAALIVDLEA
jgi:exodeoxyribonuclease III